MNVWGTKGTGPKGALSCHCALDWDAQYSRSICATDTRVVVTVVTVQSPQTTNSNTHPQLISPRVREPKVWLLYHRRLALEAGFLQAVAALLLLVTRILGPGRHSGSALTAAAAAGRLCANLCASEAEGVGKAEAGVVCEGCEEDCWFVSEVSCFAAAGLFLALSGVVPSLRNSRSTLSKSSST